VTQGQKMKIKGTPKIDIYKTRTLGFLLMLIDIILNYRLNMIKNLSLFFYAYIIGF
jgi:hypothetical protein